MTATSCVEPTPSGDNGTDTTTDPPVAEKTPCDESPADVATVAWMDALIKKHTIEEVVRYDLDEKAVYFFAIKRCCDHQSFLMDCSGTQICIDGGITGGTCKETMTNLKNKKVLWSTIEMPAEDKGKKTVEMPAEDKAPTSQPNK